MMKGLSDCVPMGLLIFIRSEDVAINDKSLSIMGYRPSYVPLRLDSEAREAS